MLPLTIIPVSILAILLTSFIILISILAILLTAARECRTLAPARPLADGCWGLWGKHTDFTQDQDYESSQFKIVANTFKFLRKILVQKLFFRKL